MRRTSLCRTATPALAGLALLLSACSSSPSGPELPEAEVRILFVGNSLTFVNDLPSLVRTVAEVAGHSVATAVQASPDFSLEEHWRFGIAGLIRGLRPDLVVMQQGPSSLPENQLHLRAWADSVARVVTEVGGTPALLMVWPSRERAFAFDAVRDSYLSASVAVGGLFMPAGEAWRAAWSVTPSLPLWGPDGFHPTQLGSLVAALTVVRTIFESPVGGLPARLVPTTPGLPTVILTPEVADVVYQAVDLTVEEWARR